MFAATPRSRLFTLLSLLMLGLQFPLAKVPVPAKFASAVPSGHFEVSIAQIAVSSYKRHSGVPTSVLKWFMAPALLSYDVNNKVLCLFDSASATCQQPVWIEKLDDIFEMTQPIMGRSDIIQSSLAAQCKANFDLLTAGASLTLGAAIISLIYPVKMGFFGYCLVLYALFKADLKLESPAFLFVPIYGLATNVLGMLGRPAARQPPPTAAALDGASGSNAAPAGGAPAASPSKKSKKVK